MSAYTNIVGTLEEVLNGSAATTLIHGEALHGVQQFPTNSIDCIITSPPYWKQREYEVGTEHSSFEIQYRTHI